MRDRRNSNSPDPYAEDQINKQPSLIVVQTIKAEREGFEPPVPKGNNGFRDRPVKPLRHLSEKIFSKPFIQTTGFSAIGGPTLGGRDHSYTSLKNNASLCYIN